MGRFCKPISPEKQREWRAREEKRIQENIDSFNKKYEDLGQEPPLFESKYDRESRCSTRIYPSGRMEYWFYPKPIYIKEKRENGEGEKNNKAREDI